MILKVEAGIFSQSRPEQDDPEESGFLRPRYPEVPRPEGFQTRILNYLWLWRLLTAVLRRRRLGLRFQN